MFAESESKWMRWHTSLCRCWRRRQAWSTWLLPIKSTLFAKDTLPLVRYNDKKRSRGSKNNSRENWRTKIHQSGRGVMVGSACWNHRWAVYDWEKSSCLSTLRLRLLLQDGKVFWRVKRDHQKQVWSPSLTLFFKQKDYGQISSPALWREKQSCYLSQWFHS